MRLSTMEYRNRKAAVMRQLNISEREYADLIKGDYHDGAGKFASVGLASILSQLDISPQFNVKVFNTDILDDWDFVWYYKRNLHVIVPEIPYYTIGVDGIDCSPITKLDKDIEIDTMLPTVSGPKATYIRLVKRNIPVKFQKSACDCTIQVMQSDGSKLRFHLEVRDRVGKVFIEGTNLCSGCQRCCRIDTTDGIGHILRPRFRDGCSVSDRFSDVFGILSTVVKVADIYVNRERISRSKKSTTDVENMKNIMVAHESVEDDGTERVMPMFDYVREYHESVKQEWKGGHHASPVSHPRSGYWRKSRHGTHILKDGEFIEVGRGLGRYIYVQPTIVNAHKDTVLAEMM